MMGQGSRTPVRKLRIQQARSVAAAHAWALLRPCVLFMMLMALCLAQAAQHGAHGRRLQEDRRTYTTVRNTKFYGDNIRCYLGILDDVTFDDCGKKCLEESSCGAFTWSKPNILGNACCLKYARGSERADPDYDSGVIISSSQLGSPSNLTPTSSDDGSSRGTWSFAKVAGIAFGCFAGLVLLVVVIVLCCRCAGAPERNRAAAALAAQAAAPRPYAYGAVPPVGTGPPTMMWFTPSAVFPLPALPPRRGAPAAAAAPAAARAYPPISSASNETWRPLERPSAPPMPAQSSEPALTLFPVIGYEDDTAYASKNEDLSGRRPADTTSAAAAATASNAAAAAATTGAPAPAAAGSTAVQQYSSTAQRASVDGSGVAAAQQPAPRQEALPAAAPLAAERASGGREDEDDGRTPPDALLCPITQCLMSDPVVAADGFTYERTAIEQWIAKSSAQRRGPALSPMTNTPLPHHVLTPNHVMRSQIKEWQQQGQQQQGR